MKNKQKTLKITNKVMKDIESGRLRMKKKEWFILKKILIVMSTVFILSGVGLCVIMADLWFKKNTETRYFPVLYLGIAFILIFMGANQYEKIGDNYKKVFFLNLMIVVFLAFAVCIFGLILERQIVELGGIYPPSGRSD